MTQDVILQLLAEWGPWGIVGLMLFRCIRRQDVREDRMSEIISNNAVAMAELKASNDAIHSQLTTFMRKDS